MSKNTPEQQEALDDILRVGLMSIGQAFYEAEQGIAQAVRDFEGKP